MRKTSRSLAALAVAFMTLGAGCAQAPQAAVQPAAEQTESTAMEQTVPGSTEGVMEKKTEATMQRQEPAMAQFTGTVLAGKSVPLLDFNKSDYDMAIKSDKLVVLYFYASWCPECQIEFPKMQAAFNGLTGDKVVGFRVNFNDSDTDDTEQSLAREFGVAYQHTKVFVKNGTRVLKAPDSWDTERYMTEIAKAIQ